MKNGYVRTVLTSVMIVVTLLFALFGAVLAADPTAEASRTIDPQVVLPGEEIDITVEFTSLLPDAHAFALLEDYPDGWTFARGTDTASTFRPGPPPEWVWFVVDAGATKTVTYTLTVPIDAEPGEYVIDGTVTADAVENPVGGDTIITVTLETLYVLTMAANPPAGGTATDLTDGSPYAEGTEVTIEAVAAEGYEFVNWTAPAGAFGNANAAETTFTMPAQNITVTANFEETPSPVLPTVTTKAASGVELTSVTLNMDYTVGDFSPVTVQFAYKKSADTTWLGTAWQTKSTDGTYARLVSGLTSGTTYDFKARLNYGGEVIEGTTFQFTTDTSPSVSCFIATAAYGTSTAEQINVLREFRDVVLLDSAVGSKFVTLYYRFSPPIANFIARNELVRTLVRELLIDPVVRLIDSTGNIWRT
jgi:Divergent InlB B-repeat domain